MNKLINKLSVLLLVVVLGACSSNDEASEKKTTTEKDQEEQSVEVEKNLLSVELTLPLSFLEGEDINTVIADAEKEGVEVTKNGEESLTYKMSKSKHKEMMAEMEKGLLETIEETKTSGDFPSIKDVTYNKDYSEFTLVVDRAAYENSFDGFAVLTFGLSGAFYQLFNGANPDDYKVTIYTKDQTTGEVFAEVVYPDALEDMETETETE